MKITYLYHSGFALEFEKISVVIDYYGAGFGPELPPALSHILDDRSRKLYVLSSHDHKDHFDSRILSFEAIREDVVYVFSSDIATNMTTLGVRPKTISYICDGESYSDGNISIHAFGSTDEGISFIIQADGKNIFHAGDLNNWHWNEECPPDESALYETNFLAELEKLALRFPSLDVALFPVDPRLGKDFCRGAEQLVTRIKTACFIPMHFGDKYEAANSFKPIAEKHDVRFFELSHKGQVIEL